MSKTIEEQAQIFLQDRRDMISLIERALKGDGSVLTEAVGESEFIEKVKFELQERGQIARKEGYKNGVEDSVGVLDDTKFSDEELLSATWSMSELRKTGELMKRKIREKLS